MLISNAYANAASSSGFSLDSIANLWPIALMFIAVYFLMIRPQKKKQKEQQDMINALGIDDEVLTSGGIIGRVLRVEETFLLLVISTGNTMLIQKTAIVSLLPKGSIDAMLQVGEASSDTDAQIEADETESEFPARQENEKKEDAGKSSPSA